MIITRKYHFYAAHRNLSAGEKCGRIHGHTYRIEIGIDMEPNENGITMLFEDIDEIVAPFIKMHDHYFLLFEQDPLREVLQKAREMYFSMPFETTAENLAGYFFTRIKGRLPEIKWLSLAETDSSTVIYSE